VRCVILSYADELMQNGRSIGENAPVLCLRYPQVDLDAAGELLRPKTAYDVAADMEKLEEMRKKREHHLDAIIENTIKIQQTDLRNSEFFSALHRETTCYCFTTKAWYIWNEERWQRDDAGQIVELGKEAIKRIYSAVAHYPDDDRQKLIKHAMKSESTGGITAMISLSQSALAAPFTSLDASPNLFNLTNGTLELDTLTFREHRKEDLLTKMSGVAYVPGTYCPKWRSHLDLIFASDLDLILGFQVMCGYSLLATNPEQIFNLLWGRGLNGKSVTLQVLRTILGEYAIHIAPETLMVKKFAEGPRSDIARMAGARLITCTEGESEKRLAIGLLKAFTGADPITVRSLYQTEFTFQPGGKIWYATNHKPQIPEHTLADWRRVLLWPFLVTIPPERRIKDYETHLLQEAPGIFQWMLEGLRRYRERGLCVPEKVREATRQYEEEQDPLGEWRAACTAEDPTSVLSFKDLYQNHQAWERAAYLDELTFKPMSSQRFGRLLGERYERVLQHGIPYYRGLRLVCQGTLRGCVG
jgi:putative DNA primase/helicase